MTRQKNNDAATEEGYNWSILSWNTPALTKKQKVKKEGKRRVQNHYFCNQGNGVYTYSRGGVGFKEKI